MSSSFARWLKSVLQSAGVDTSIFTAHSVRGASVSKTANMAVTTKDILKAANWSSESVFQRFIPNLLKLHSMAKLIKRQIRSALLFSLHFNLLTYIAILLAMSHVKKKSKKNKSYKLHH